MVLVFQTNDIFMFTKDFGTYTGGQIIILGQKSETVFDVLGDIRKDGEEKPAHVSASTGWLESLYQEGIIKFIGEKK